MAYVGVFLLIMALVAVGYRSPEHFGSSASADNGLISKDNVAAPTVDEVVAANVAANIATTVNLPVAANIENLSQSLSAQNALAQNDNNVVAKPQVVQPSADNRAVRVYTTKVGDTTGSVGAQFSISAQTVRWANNLTSDALEPNQQLKILPVNGVLHTVAAGDTIESLASKYQTTTEQIKVYNDLELSQGLTPGAQIIIPGGVLPNNEQPGYIGTSARGSRSSSSSYSSASSSMAAASIGNRYVYGECTWYAYNRRAQLGRPVGSFWGNAATWDYYARQAGYRVDQSPEVGAVLQTGGGYYGHVGVVESVSPGDSITISEMNYSGWNRIDNRTISWSDAVSGYYNYIH